MSMPRAFRPVVAVLFSLAVPVLAAPVTTQPLARWRSVATRVGAFNSVSCADANFCVATGWSAGTDYSVTYNGKTWSAAHQVVQYEGELGSISCPVVGWCAAVTDLAAVTFFYDGRWSKLVGVDRTAGAPYPGTVAAVSCTSRDYCVVVDGQGKAETFAGRRWSKPALVDTNYPLNAVSCGAPGHCVAVDGDGRALVLDRQQWSAPQVVHSAALTGVACACTGFCVATDVFGNALVSRGWRWSAPGRVDELAASPVSLSCPGVGRCLAVDGQGAYAVLEGGRWGRPQVIDSQSASSGGLVGVSCPPGGTKFCAAVDSAGNALTATAAFSG